MAENLIKKFKQISKVDIEIAGGKGASLGEMTQAGVPVPEGFVILSNSFNRFIEKTDLNVEIEAALDTVDIKKVHTIENSSEKIQAMILSKEIPEDIKIEILKFYKNLDCKFVAVRSSATSEDSASAAWAGQLDSFLNTTEETLLENVKKCWASLFTPRAIFYRFENNLRKDKISVAVVVQKMVDSEESGIAFSVHPVTQDENQIIIEAGFGLGEAIVSGSITPDSYVVEKRGFNILDTNVNEQTKALYKKSNGGNEWKELKEKGREQVLTEKEIIELSKLIVKIEKHYDFPCDIEWAKEKGKFYITQSRPITTLKNKEDVKKETKRDDYFFIRKRFVPVIWPVYTFWRKVYKDLGIHTGKIFHVYDKGEYTGILSASFTAEVSDNLFPELQKKVKNFSKFREESAKVGNNLVEFCRINAENFENISIKEIIEFYNKADVLCDELYMNNMIYWAVCERKATTQLYEKLKKFSKNEQEEILRTLTFPEYDTYSKIEEKEFDKLVNFVKKNGINSEKSTEKIQKFSDKYVWFLFEYAGPKLYDFETVKNRVEEELRDDKYIDKSNGDYKSQKEKIISKYNLGVDVVRLSKIVSDLSILQDDRKRFNSESCYWVNGIILDKLSRRLNIPIELLKYLDKELLNEHQNNNDLALLKNELIKRADFLVIQQENGKVEFFSGDEGKELLINEGVKYDEEVDSSMNEFKGQTAYPGLIQGIVKILKHSGESKEFSDKNILVTSMTTPDFIFFMKKAKAIITDEGGITSHASIVSRELEKPCIIGTKIATKVLNDGDLVEVDANQGIVRVLKKAKNKVF